MEPKIVTLPAFKIAGYELKTSTIDNKNLKEIPLFWTTYMADGKMEKLHAANFVEDHAEYGACFPEDLENGEFSYIIGVKAKPNSEISDDFYACEIPAATYAVFSTPPCERKDFSRNIQGTWQYIMNEWFASSGYGYATGKADFELYGEKSRGENDLICEIYIPITKKQ
jgi:Uncharacterized protein conserved in bacteria